MESQISKTIRLRNEEVFENKDETNVFLQKIFDSGFISKERTDSIYATGSCVVD